MATRTVCDYPTRGDICGEAVEAPVEVTVDGKTHVLEICSHHAEPVRALVEKVGGKRPQSRTNGRSKNGRSRKVTDADIRAWATAEGYQVSPTGRVAQALKDAYAEAH